MKIHSEDQIVFFFTAQSPPSLLQNTNITTGQIKKNKASKQILESFNSSFNSSVIPARGFEPWITRSADAARVQLTFVHFRSGCDSDPD